MKTGMLALFGSGVEKQRELPGADVKIWGFTPNLT